MYRMDRSEEKRQKDRREAAKLLTMVSQFAFTMLTPVLGCFFAGLWLDKKLGTGFLAVLLFFIGTLAGFTGVYKLAKEFMGGNGMAPGSAKDTESSVDRDTDIGSHS